MRADSTQATTNVSALAAHTVPKHRAPWAVPLSLLAHAALLAALVFSVAWKSNPPPPAAQAELWDALPSQAAPVAALKDDPKPEMVKSEPVKAEPVKPGPVKPESVKSTLEKLPTPPATALATKTVKAKPKAVEPEEDDEEQAPVKPKKSVKPVAKPVDKPVDKPVVKPVDKPPAKLEPKPTPPKVLVAPKPNPEVERAAQRELERTKELARLNGLLAGSTTTTTTTTTNTATSNAAPNIGRPQAGTAAGLGQGWGAKLQACIKPFVNFSEVGVSGNPRVGISVQLSANGKPSNVVVTQSSGSPAFDDAVARATESCNPFPQPETGAYPATMSFGYRLKG